MPGSVVFRVTVPSKLFVNKLTSPPNNTTEEVRRVPVPGSSFASMSTTLGVNVVAKLAESL